MTDTTLIVTSPAWTLIREDVVSALVGLGKMVVGTTIVFLAGLLEKYLSDPSGLLKADWIAIGTAYLMLQLSTVVTFTYNLLIKWIRENKYIAS